MPPKSKAQPKSQQKSQSVPPKVGRPATKKFANVAVNSKKTQTQFTESSGNGAISYCTRKYKKQSKLNNLVKSLKTTAMCRYQDMFPVSQSANAGLQSYQFYKSSYGGLNITPTNADYSDLCVIKNILNVNLSGAQAQNTVKWVSFSVSEELMITNQDNTTTQMYIFDVYTKKDVNRSPWGVWSVALTDQITGSTYTYGQTSVTTSVSPATPGQLPTSVNEFNKYFGVKGKTRVILSPGETHIHKKYNNKVRVVDYDRASNNVSIAGVTEYTLIITLGFPANDTVNKVTEINYGTSKLDVIHKINHTFKRYAYAYNNQYVQQVPNVGFTNNESTMNPTSATAVTASSQA